LSSSSTASPGGGAAVARPPIPPRPSVKPKALTLRGTATYVVGARTTHHRTHHARTHTAARTP
jgi:hypothetical protein